MSLRPPWRSCPWRLVPPPTAEPAGYFCCCCPLGAAGATVNKLARRSSSIAPTAAADVAALGPAAVPGHRRLRAAGPNLRQQQQAVSVSTIAADKSTILS
jgi:hypothetical protein